MLNRNEIKTPITDAEEHKDSGLDPGFDWMTEFARDLERDRTELMDALDYWLNGTQKSQARFADDTAMLARMKERK